ncbi:MAG: 4-hydroxyphenylpyruvate dioxygenase [Gammaproteobacteria bacterium RIFCSPHIGHO2_12_FULL_42_13]|nr:MAG: 4-hydroxyphenylpyruvate dioxygenase [Gammaproteobacteria bacterium RIFCSPHIGHO2_12_FULL_42_13]
MQVHNPAGTDGFDFLEFASPDPKKLVEQFTSMGFTPVAKHKHADITLYQQNDIRFLVNLEKNSQAMQFAELHGPSTSAMGFRVKDAHAAYQHAIANGAIPYEAREHTNYYQIPAIYGVGNSLIYFIDYRNDNANYADQFTNLITPATKLNGLGLTYIDHVTHNLFRGHMNEWAEYYNRIFNFNEVRYFDIEGRLTGLVSRAMASPCGKIRIPLNESADDQSQIEEFLKSFNGEGIQHIALGTNNIYDSVEKLHRQGIIFLDTPDTYFELIEDRLPNHGEPLDLLKKHRILLDGESKKAKKLLLQIFTQNMLGPVFFEIIQRKGDEGFGEGNFRALFESIELDQIRRGVIKVEEEKL